MVFKSSNGSISRIWEEFCEGRRHFGDILRGGDMMSGITREPTIFIRPLGGREEEHGDFEISETKSKNL